MEPRSSEQKTKCNYCKLKTTERVSWGIYSCFIIIWKEVTCWAGNLLVRRVSLYFTSSSSKQFTTKTNTVPRMPITMHVVGCRATPAILTASSPFRLALRPARNVMAKTACSSSSSTGPNVKRVIGTPHLTTLNFFIYSSFLCSFICVR